MLNMKDKQVLLFEKKVLHSRKNDKDFYVATCVHEVTHDKFDMFITMEEFNNAEVGEYYDLVPMLDNFAGKVTLKVALAV